jgi:alpha-L-fucosidase 2
MSKSYPWHFPLPRTHTGMLLGNGTFGAMIWGTGQTLRITLGRADYWDHRGGLTWTEAMSYATIRHSLEAGDEARLGDLFRAAPGQPGEPPWPSVLPIGRLELDLGADAELVSGEVDMQAGEITLHVRKHGKAEKVRLLMSMTAPVVACHLSKGLARATIQPVTAWDYVGAHLADIAFTPPEPFAAGELTGWVQARPADPPLCVAWVREGRDWFFTAVLATAEAEPRALAAHTLAEATTRGWKAVRADVHTWWKRYWKGTAQVTLPNERLQFLYDYGMYKFAGLTNPTGVPATLQGPWIEEYQMPPWSSDYHFNINVQMCYWPAFHGNCLEHLRPLFAMVERWTPLLQHNARVFAGIEDGRMLPHAVDDRGVCIGGFWSGSLDHGCTAWVAQMMYRYFRYTRDLAFLRDTAYPFMVGAMRVYEAMLEQQDGRYSLPVSVSPEYHTKEAHSPWGRNASFQLACIHRLCADLQDAAAELDLPPAPQWADIAAHLPKACLIGNDGEERIAIWDGTPLEESHRHHSHLAGLTPFDIFDLADPAERALLARSLDDWLYHGPGLWSGWCVPWAAMLHLRLDPTGGAAELLLEAWERVFTNIGHGTLHDADIPGLTLFGQRYAQAMRFTGRAHEVMQMDAGMSCTTAIQEMLLHERRGVVHLFAGAPRRWRDVAFSGMRTDGAFLVSATRARGVVTAVTVESLAGGTFQLANPWGDRAELLRLGFPPEPLLGATLALPLGPGETVTVTPGH